MSSFAEKQNQPQPQTSFTLRPGISTSAAAHEMRPATPLRRTWMPFSVKENEAANPIDICLFGAPAVAPCAHERAHLIQEFGLAWSGSFWRNGADLKFTGVLLLEYSHV